MMQDYLELAEHAVFRAKTHEDIRLINGHVPFDDGVDAWQTYLTHFARLQDIADECVITVKHYTMRYALVSVHHPQHSSFQGFATVQYTPPGVLDFWHDRYQLLITDIVHKGFYQHTYELLDAIRPFLNERIRRVVEHTVPYPAATLHSYYQLSLADIEQGRIDAHRMTVYGYVFHGRSQTLVHWILPEAVSLNVPDVIDAIADERTVNIGAVTVTYPKEWTRSIGYMRSQHIEVTPDNVLSILMGAHG